MAESTRGLLDASVVIDLTSIDSGRLPDESAVAAVTLAELAAGRMPRTIRTRQLAVRIDCSGPRRPGRRSRSTRTQRGPTAVSLPPCERPVEVNRPRLADLLVAATAISNGLPVYTRNADDFSVLEGLLEVVAV